LLGFSSLLFSLSLLIIFNLEVKLASKSFGAVPMSQKRQFRRLHFAVMLQTAVVISLFLFLPVLSIQE
jgi:hypothetical protein